MTNVIKLTSGFFARTDKGSFTHWFDESLPLDEARDLVRSLLRGHDIRDVKIYALNGSNFYTFDFPEFDFPERF